MLPARKHCFCKLFIRKTNTPSCPGKAAGEFGVPAPSRPLGAERRIHGLEHNSFERQCQPNHAAKIIHGHAVVPWTICRSVGYPHKYPRQLAWKEVLRPTLGRKKQTRGIEGKDVSV